MSSIGTGVSTDWLFIEITNWTFKFLIKIINTIYCLFRSPFGAAPFLSCHVALFVNLM